MSTEEVKAARIRPPFDYTTTANNFGVLKFTAGTAADTQIHSANVIPLDWVGKWVEIYVTGGTAGTDAMHYAFSRVSTAEVDRAVAATAAGASVKVGGVVPTGTAVQVQIPYGTGPTVESPVYFVRESTTTGMVAYMRLASP